MIERNESGGTRQRRSSALDEIALVDPADQSVGASVTMVFEAD
jgi:hypothetical protein